MMKQVLANLFDAFENYKEISLSKRRFKHKDILPLIDKHNFEKQSLGFSYENREIFKLKLGNGTRKILLWSQMHGNEATATMASFDIFNFFEAKNDGFDAIKSEILNACELHFIPMLNPDGAERFNRRTAIEIDMNRDAIALQCVESNILKNTLFDLQPEFSFNLHDQDVRYSAGNTSKQATISFLATAYNPEREWNDVRIKSRQVINQMNDILQQFNPGGVGRFSDEFEPRAFGDNIQKWGSSLVLIESGGYPNDIEKQYIRKLNFIAIIGALLSISRNNYNHFTLADYEAIPTNEKYLFDLKITNLVLKNTKGNITIDLGVNFEEKNNDDASDFENVSVIEDLGDLSVFWGINTFDAQGGIFRSFDDFPELAQKHNIKKNIELPKIGQEANFIIEHGNELTVVVNGNIVD